MPNHAEQLFIRSRRGQPPLYRRGWPDYWWVNPDGQFCVAEVKPTCGSPLRAAQFEILSHLHGAGVRAYTWNPDTGLCPFDPGLWRLWRTHTRYYYWPAQVTFVPDGTLVEGLPASVEYARALRGRVSMGEPVTALPADGVIPQHHQHRLSLYRLVRMALTRRNRLSGEPEGEDREAVAYELQALSWVLEQIGFPPSRYDEVLDKCLPRRGRGKGLTPAPE